MSEQHDCSINLPDGHHRLPGDGSRLLLNGSVDPDRREWNGRGYIFWIRVEDKHIVSVAGIDNDAFRNEPYLSADNSNLKVFERDWKIKVRDLFKPPSNKTSSPLKTFGIASLLLLGFSAMKRVARSAQKQVEQKEKQEEQDAVRKTQVSKR